MKVTIEVKLPPVTYIRMVMEKSTCPCGRNITLLCPSETDLPTEMPSFFICWQCRKISRPGIGPVEEDKS